MRRTLVTLLAASLLAALVLPLTLSPARGAPDEDLAPKLRGALAVVHVTSQGWNLMSPWNKANPVSRSLRGVMVRPGLLLTPANGLADHIMIEVSEANSARTYPASLEHVDYGANLALVKVESEELASRMAPLPIGGPITIDDEFEIWQLGESNLLERYTGMVQKVSVSNGRLELTVKTNLADAGDGQAALRDGHLVGLVSWTRASRQEGQLIALETIRHYLDDHEDGDYLGSGAGGIWTHDLLRDDLRRWYGIPEGEHGLGVSRVLPGRTGDGAVRERDVIAGLAGFDLDDEGMFVHPLHGRIHMGFLLYGSRHPGDEVEARIFRGGEEMTVKIPVRAWPDEEQRVPSEMYDQRPPYLIVGGLVLLELNRHSPVGRSRLGQYQARTWWDPPEERKRIVYASRVLADPANKGLDEIGNTAVLAVNGRKITRLQDVAEALETPLDGFHVITFEELENDFVIEAASLAEIDARIAERYKIPELRYLPE